MRNGERRWGGAKSNGLGQVLFVVSGKFFAKI